MAATPTTSASLLLRVRDARDGQAWTQFEELYAPLIHGFARKRGLQDADAADLTQDVLRLVARAGQQRQYDPQIGSVCRWAFTRGRNPGGEILRKSRAAEEGGGRPPLE